MMRLPRFRYYAPSSVREAAAILDAEGPGAMVVAGGTDLYPNMKRRHQTPAVLVGLRRIERLRGVRRGATRGSRRSGAHAPSGRAAGGFTIGPATTLTELEENGALRSGYPGLHQAIRSISTPILRNMGTIGGNICLDTRCNYYDQNYEWRRAINFCMKCDGDICWVAPGSDVCLAVNSSDSAPVLCALGARLHLVSRRGERVVEAKDLYRPDGIRYLTKRPDEILTAIELPPEAGWRSSYRKLRRRGAFDFPVLGVAACLQFEGDGDGAPPGARRIAAARLWLGAVSMAPVEAAEAARALVGRPLDEETIAAAARLAYPLAKPVDNTDFLLRYRKEMTRHLVTLALRDLSPSAASR
jgi:4-hydroxybenzoyl-CoA reductase subunit beta